MSDTSNPYVLSIMSRDRVGIIYEISKAISELEGNIADIRQSVLSGFFTMILLAYFPKEVTQRAIERKLSEVDARSETALSYTVKPAKGPASASATPIPADAYVLTASGADRVGFVATLTSFCASHHINILDLSTTASAGEYVMMLLVDLSRAAPLNEVRVELNQFAQKSGLKVVLQHYDIFRAVNEINLRIR